MQYLFTLLNIGLILCYTNHCRALQWILKGLKLKLTWNLGPLCLWAHTKILQLNKSFETCRRFFSKLLLYHYLEVSLSLPLRSHEAVVSHEATSNTVALFTPGKTVWLLKRNSTDIKRLHSTISATVQYCVFFLCILAYISILSFIKKMTQQKFFCQGYCANLTPHVKGDLKALKKIDFET